MKAWITKYTLKARIIVADARLIGENIVERQFEHRKCILKNGYRNPTGFSQWVVH